MSTEKFFNTLFKNKPPESYILIWTNEGHASHWAKTVDEAVRFTKDLDSKIKGNVYYGCGVSPQDFGRKNRCDADKIFGIPGLWLDIDVVSGDAHSSKKTYPKTYEEAQSLIEAFPLKPSMVIHSGHGYHLWWVFSEFWSFADKGQDTQAAALVEEFIKTFKQYFKLKGFDIDSVFDLARVLRAPGTHNRKGVEVVPVTFQEYAGTTYSMFEIRTALNEFQGYFPYDPAAVVTTAKVAKAKGVSVPVPSTGQFSINPNAKPPGAKFETLMTVNDKFAATWNMKRKDMKDQSPSSYDYSLANFALYYEWQWQEIIDLLIAFRRENGLEPKLRESYYITTLTNAAATLRKDESMEQLAETITVTGGNKEKQKQSVTAFRNNLSDIIGVQINRIKKYMKDPPEYVLETESGSIHLGQIQNLLDQRLFRMKLAAATNFYMKPVKTERWHDVVAPALLAACEEESAGDESTDMGLLAIWISQYVHDNAPLYDIDDAMQMNKPFFYWKWFVMFGPAFREYLQTMRREKVGAKDMGFLLKEFGFVPVTMHYINDKKIRTSKNVWRLPLAHEVVAPYLDEILLDEANRLRDEVPKIPRGDRPWEKS
ncbi:MAG: hypothetical protein CSYNP_03538 [Syntrophus sp. SKADARSKE-3]|nr:hypothetical protein [Syntrophus sp. SKADARSKE-3]